MVVGSSGPQNEAIALLRQILKAKHWQNGETGLEKCQICFTRRDIDEMDPIFDPEDPENGFLGWECWEHNV